MNRIRTGLPIRISARVALVGLATLFAVFGWFSGGINDPSNGPAGGSLSENGSVDIVTVVVVWGFSIAVTICIGIVYYVMTGMSILNDLGRKKRSASDTMMENILTHLSKVAVEHETDEHGSRYYLAQKAVVEEDE